jgi:hypothetical protein
LRHLLAMPIRNEPFGAGDEIVVIGSANGSLLDLSTRTTFALIIKFR